MAKTEEIEEYGFPFESMEIEEGKYDRGATSADWARYVSSMFTDGYILTPPDILTGFEPLKVTAQAGMTVGVGKGIILIGGRMRIFSQNTLITLEQAESKPRIDLICMRLDLNAEGRRIYHTVIKGSASDTPAEPTYIRDDVIYDMVVAKVLVPAEVAKLNQSDITDTRNDTVYCGRSMTSDASGLVPVVEEVKERLYKGTEPAVEQIYTYGAPKKQIADYRTAGTYVWEVPAGVYCIDVFLMGGGGGAASIRNSTYASASGGGGAGYFRNIKKKAVVPGQKINVIVGSGGAGGGTLATGVNSAAGTNGGTTSFDGVTVSGGGQSGSSAGAGVTSGVNGTGGSPSTMMNINDLGLTYGRRGVNGQGTAAECDVDVGSGGDGGYAAVGAQVAGKNGKAGCVMIYAYLTAEGAGK